MNPHDPVPMAVPRTYHAIRLAQLERANASLLDAKHADNATIARLRKENRELRKILDRGGINRELHVIRHFLLPMLLPGEQINRESIINLYRYVSKITGNYNFRENIATQAHAINADRKHLKLVKD